MKIEYISHKINLPFTFIAGNNIMEVSAKVGLDIKANSSKRTTELQRNHARGYQPNKVFYVKLYCGRSEFQNSVVRRVPIRVTNVNSGNDLEGWYKHLICVLNTRPRQCFNLSKVLL